MSEPRSEYRLIIQQESDGSNAPKKFTGWLPENISYSMSSQFESPFKPFLDNGIATGMRMMGLSAMASSMTAQVWSGTDTPEIQLECKVYAEEDPLKEIRRPVLDLLSMVTPEESNASNTMTGGMLLPPGPRLNTEAILGSTVKYMKESGNSTSSTIGSGIENGYNAISGSTLDTSKSLNGNPLKASSLLEQGVITKQISVSIGEFMYFRSVVVTEVSCDFPVQIHYKTGWPMSVTLGITFKPLFLPTTTEHEYWIF